MIRRCQSAVTTRLTRMDIDPSLDETDDGRRQTLNEQQSSVTSQRNVSHFSQSPRRYLTRSVDLKARTCDEVAASMRASPAVGDGQTQLWRDVCHEIYVIVSCKLLTDTHGQLLYIRRIVTRSETVRIARNHPVAEAAAVAPLVPFDPPRDTLAVTAAIIAQLNDRDFRRSDSTISCLTMSLLLRRRTLAVNSLMRLVNRTAATDGL
jgi:hypothetical protein